MAEVIAAQDMGAIRMFQMIFGRFEREAGFPMPGIRAREIIPDVAASYGAGSFDEDRMLDLAAKGFIRQENPRSIGSYVLAERFERGMAVLGADGDRTSVRDDRLDG